MADLVTFQKYAEEMNKFITGMTPVFNENDPKIPEIIAPLAEVLRIGRIELAIYENPSTEMGAPMQQLLLYSARGYDNDRAFFYREFIGNGNVIHYKLYYIDGEPEHDPQVREWVDAFEKILNTYMEKCRMKGMIEYFMMHDSQMDMHNSAYFTKRVGEFANQGILSRFAVCYFNLKQFYLINEFVGRWQGTAVMKGFIKEVKKVFTGGEEFVCRVGGDNFVALCYKEHLEALLSVLKGTGITANNVAHNEVTVSASAGIYLLPDEKLQANDIVDRAAVACKVAKNDRRTSVAYFDDQMLYVENNAKRVQSMFPEALVNGEFHVYYQPKVNLEDYHLAGAEALCRWIHDGELITPDKFIPIFERKGLIGQLDFFMLEHVCMDIRKWLDEGKSMIPVSVNLSRCHFEDKKLFEHIMEIIDKYRIPHELIEIELTETTTDVDFSDLKDIVMKLKNQGIYDSRHKEVFKKTL